MVSTVRQFLPWDPQPSNLGGLDGLTPSRIFLTLPLDTLAGSAIIVGAQIANFAGGLVSGVEDSVNGSYTLLDDIHPTTGACDTALYRSPNNPAVVPAGDHGTTTGGSTTTLVDSSKSWTTNQWAGKTLTFPSLSTRSIVSNTATTLTLNSGATVNAGSPYAIGGYWRVAYNPADDYDAGFVAEISGVTTTPFAGHSARKMTIGSGTNNIDTNASATLAAGNYGVFSFSFNDTLNGTPGTPAAGGGATSVGTGWKWNTGKDGLRAQFKNVTLASAGTITSQFSSAGASDEYLSFQVILAEPPGWTSRSVGAYVGGFNALTPAMPSGFQAGDVLILYTGSGTGLSSPTLSVSGWTELSTSVNGKVNKILGRIALAGDTSPSVNWSNSASVTCFAMIKAYVGGTLTVHAAVDRASTTTNNIAYGSLTITAPNCLVLACGKRVKSSTSDGATIGSLTNFTNVANVVQAGGNSAASFNEWFQTSPTNCSLDIQTMSIADPSALNTQGMTVALLPAIASVATPTLGLLGVGT